MRLRDEDRILVYEVGEPSQSPSEGPSAPAHYGFLYHRIDANLVGDPLLFTFDAKTTCHAYVFTRSWLCIAVVRRWTER